MYPKNYKFEDQQFLHFLNVGFCELDNWETSTFFWLIKYKLSMWFSRRDKTYRLFENCKRRLVRNYGCNDYTYSCAKITLIAPLCFAIFHGNVYIVVYNYIDPWTLTSWFNFFSFITYIFKFINSYHVSAKLLRRYTF